MGDLLSKANNYQDPEFMNQFQAEYIFLQDHIDHRLGRVKIYQGKQENYIAVKKVFAQQKDQFKQYIEKTLLKNIQFNNHFLIKLYTFQTHQDDSFCSQVNDIEIYLEYYVNTVQEEIQRRIQVNLPYIEQEIWTILYSIISAATYLESKNLSLNDIRPQNVYFTTRGEIKLIPFGMFPEDQTAFQKYMNLNEPCLLSPEQLHKLYTKQFNLNIDQNKSDVFSIGMTILYCMMLQGSSVCYDYENCEINKEVLYNLIQYSSQQYSNFLLHIITLMLQENPQERPFSSTIHAMLQPFEIEIMSLQPFNPDSMLMKQSLLVNGQAKNMIQSKIFPGEHTNIGVSQVIQQQQQEFYNNNNSIMRNSYIGNKQGINDLENSNYNQGNNTFNQGNYFQNVGINQFNQQNNKLINNNNQRNNSYNQINHCFYQQQNNNFDKKYNDIYNQNSYSFNNNNEMHIQVNQAIQRTHQVLGNRLYE
ncbi:protein kinase domain protein [Ichthyophthirius multifiliis]|uniref:Protein kinase domain protein n=1 Tax=Ichthyophthirius multifiliis TaxID=5932 RepID=G0R097_ICHMU|nr:protein kinase domain protein [Ichthyophthirius multifiliis]EGR29105.1 protein kinase domain protein [Ichthyophthirius multifiliis]|eukprot:XP_004030341.1 protein kinase domain protein [Ichthyophthirius multifiliis]